VREQRDTLTQIKQHWTLRDLTDAHRVGDFEAALHDLQQEEP
jgi:hypothetical protein